jgi:hypothetical protein
MLDRVFQLIAQYQRHLAQLSWLRVSSYSCTQLGLVLRQLLHTAQTTKSQHLDFCTFNLLLPTTCFGQSCDHQGEKIQVQKVRSSFPVSSKLFMKDFTTFTAQIIFARAGRRFIQPRPVTLFGNQSNGSIQPVIWG